MLSIRRSFNRSRIIGQHYIFQQHLLLSTTHVNSLQQIKHHFILDRAREKLCDIDHKSGSRLPIAVPSNVNTDIKIVIDTCKKPKEIVAIIERNQDMIVHASIYGKAMQKCNKLRDFESVHKIMNMLLTSGLKIDTCIEFTIYINSMALSAYPHRCISMFKIMVDKYNIEPNEITFSSLIKSFRMPCKYKQAEEIWHLMTEKYNLVANPSTYTSMMTIYAAAHEVEKANKLFSEYMFRFKNNQLGYCGIFGAYVTVFSKVGDIKAMRRAINIGMKYGMELQPYLVGTIMTGYYSARKFKKCVKIFNTWMNASKHNIPNNTLLHLKCIALCGQIKNKFKNEKAFAEKEKLYNEIVNCLTIAVNKYEIKLDSMNAKIQLSAAIFCYYNHAPMKIINVFESLLSRNLIGYLPANKTYGYIDVHVYEPSDAQFIVRYLIGFKLEEILKDQNNLHIITGKGKHTQGKSSCKGQMYNIIANELLSWNPPIVDEIGTNSGCIYIGKQQLLPYLNDNNYAKQKLCKPCDDWYYKDPRKKNKIKREKYSDMYGSVNRKRVSTKFINELITTLKYGQIFKVFNTDGDDRKYKAIRYIDNTDFIVYDFKDKSEKKLNMKTILYKLLL